MEMEVGSDVSRNNADRPGYSSLEMKRKMGNLKKIVTLSRKCDIGLAE